LVLLFVSLRDPGPQGLPGRLIALAAFLTGILLAFAALNLLAAGLYRMLGHLYRSISRTDLATDRPMRGRTVFLLGLIGLAMAIPLASVFLIVGDTQDMRQVGEVFAILIAVPIGLLTIASTLTLIAGLGIMVWDMFRRHQDIVDTREAERRRRIAEAEEAMTEVVPASPVDTLREHVKEDR
jgi:hypothetical protein